MDVIATTTNPATYAAGGFAMPWHASVQVAPCGRTRTGQVRLDGRTARLVVDPTIAAHGIPAWSPPT